MTAPLYEILVADDDPAMRDLMTRAFGKDFRITLAKDGTEALAMLEQTKPVALIVDEMMPGATGTEVLERAKTVHPDAMRVLMTATSDNTHAMKAINQGEIHRFYVKPLKIMEVRRAIVDLVEKAQAELALRVELRTLRTLKETSQANRAAPQTRVVIAGVGEGGDRVEAACKLRGFLAVRVRRAEDMAQACMQAPTDVVALVSIGPEVRSLARLAHTIDEATAVIIVDDDAKLERAMLALEIGAVDYLAPPFSEEVALASRLERAAARPRSQRDMRRLTFDLVVANRDLVLARKRVEAEQVQLLNAMIRALEARDPYTAGHTDRVSAISVRCGQVLGMEPARLDVVRMGALLHDIGKIGVRDAVLLKPGRLTNEEFEAIKTHTTIGATLLGDIEQFRCIVPVVRGHHEKLDGTGYPDGLKAEQIILEVRVVSASDVLDAVTSTRPYRRGSTAEEAFDIMQGHIGRHLDPVVVAALHQMHKDGRLVELLQPGGGEGPGPAPYV